MAVEAKASFLPRHCSCFALRLPLVRLSFHVCALMLLLSLSVWGQTAARDLSVGGTQPEPPKDQLGRTTPRGTVLGFLIASRKNSYDVAAQYLNTRLKGRAAEKLARQLSVVLDRYLPPTLNQLSNQPQGSASNPVKPNEEIVGTISRVDGNLDILVERVDRGKAGSLWLFAPKTLKAIPDLYDEIDFVPVESVLPDFLVSTRIFGIPLFELLAVIVGMPVFYLAISLVSWLLSPLVGLVLRRVSRNRSLRNPTAIPKPIRLLLLALIIRWLLSTVGLPLLARQVWSGIASTLTTASIIWLLILLIGYGERLIVRYLHAHKRKEATAMLRLGRRVVDVLILLGGLIQILWHFGMNPTAALAGLGIGGIAVALAAQKTLENVIGGISLIFDQVIRVGDIIRLGDTIATVDEIGLRSTRFRTLDRTMLSMPNGQLAAINVDNLSARDKFWLHPIIRLDYRTTFSQVQAVLEGIHALLERSYFVESKSFHVRLLRFGPGSLELEVFAYLAARDWGHFLELQEAILLSIMECVEATGTKMAAPLQAVISAPAITSSYNAIPVMAGSPETPKATAAGVDSR